MSTSRPVSTPEKWLPKESLHMMKRQPSSAEQNKSDNCIILLFTSAPFLLSPFLHGTQSSERIKLLYYRKSDNWIISMFHPLSFAFRWLWLIPLLNFLSLSSFICFLNFHFPGNLIACIIYWFLNWWFLNGGLLIFKLRSLYLCFTVIHCLGGARKSSI